MARVHERRWCFRRGPGVDLDARSGREQQLFYDGAKHYAVTRPPDVPEARFWLLTVYDNQTRSMLVTPQRFPRAGSQSYPTPAAVSDADGNWIQSMRGKGWFVILRLSSPQQPFFDTSWRVGEVQPA